MWKNLVKKALLCGVCAGSLLWPYEADAARRKYDNKRTKRTERISRRDRTTPSYPTPKTPEVPPEHKLAHFKQQILKTPNAELSPKDKTMFIQALDILASVPRGRWIIENAPSDLKFRILKGTSHNGLYNHGTIFLRELSEGFYTHSKEIQDRDMHKKALTLAHEMTHAIQNHRGMLNTPLHHSQEVMTINKLGELHALLEECRINRQFKQPLKNSKYNWVYILEDEKKQEGSSAQEASRFARTEFVKRFWKNQANFLISLNGKKVYTPEVIDIWNQSYNQFYFDGNFINGKTSPTKMDKILRSYIRLMEIDAHPDFFLSPETTAFKVQKNKLTTYLNGILRQELHMLDEGKLEKEYRNGELLYIRLYNKKISPKREDKTFYFEGGHASYSIQNGEISGIYREYDASGKQILEIPMEGSRSEGTGWQLKKTGEKKILQFRRTNFIPYQLSKQKN